MANQELIDFIIEQKKLKRFPHEIREMLVDNGWGDVEINKAFHDLANPSLLSALLKKKKPIITIGVVVLLIGLGLTFRNQLKTLFLDMTVKFEKPVVIIDEQTVDEDNILGELGTTTSDLAEENVEGENSATVEYLGLSPKESYTEMKEVFDKIAKYEDLKDFYYKYGSQEKISEFNKTDLQTLSLPESFKEQIVSLVKSSIPFLEEITNISESIENDQAILNVGSIISDLKGIVILIREDDAWKLDSEGWVKKAF